MTRTRIVTTLAATASLVAISLAAPLAGVATPDPHALHQQKTNLDQSIKKSQADLDDISTQLLRAKNQLTDAQADLAQARSRLTSVQAQVAVATQRDAAMQAALDSAIARLSSARTDLTQGRRDMARQRGALAAYAVSSYEAQVGQLSTLNLIFQADSSHQVISAVQGADSAMARQLSDLERLRADQVMLRLREQSVARDEARVAAARRQAAANLVAKKRLESAAADAETVVSQRVGQVAARRTSFAAAKVAEIAKIHRMEKQRSALLARLKKIAEARARAHQTTLASAPPPSTDGGYLSYPVRDTYITSPYGMRMNPVIHVYELHDGTDFHALCGTPVYAAAAGRVSQEYWSDAYGNRVFIDHGFVRGVSLWTSYNHLTSYVAHVGEQVARGQLIAYSGTTGWSTGCHLHFSVYVNGSTVDPMTWL